MIKNNVMGIIFANSNDELVPQFTMKRSMASIPFGGRYRVIDFALSNFVNAGISKVGIITKSNYNSLLDHLGSGISWDLDRKNGGLFMLPPFSTNKAGFFNNRIDALAGVMTFLKRSNEKYVVLTNSDIVSNIDIDKLISAHKKSGAGITVAYKNGVLPKSQRETMVLNISSDNTVEDVCYATEITEAANYSIDLFVIERNLLIDIVSTASKYNKSNPTKEMLTNAVGDITVKAYEIKEFAEIIYSKERYAEISMGLLCRDTRKQLFSDERPVYTKTRDDMPTRYGVTSTADNCLIAGGSVIDGTVKDSILFRAVTVGSDTEINNSIIMQGAKIGKGCKLENVIIDKAAVISDGMTLIGKPDNYIYIEKGKII